MNIDDLIPPIDEYWLKRLDSKINLISHKSTIKFRARCLRNLIGMIIYSSSKHNKRKDSFYITKNFFRDYLGANGKFLDKLWGYIQHHPGIIFNSGINSKHPAAREASSYRITEDFIKDILEFYSTRPEITSTPEIFKYSIGNISNIPSHIEINTKAMRELALNEKDFRALNTIYLSELSNGFIPNQYRHNQNTGRYDGLGPSLQLINKKYIRVALEGMGVFSQVDASTCAQSIMYQHPRFKSIDFSHTKYYVENKARVRREISEEIGASVEQVKKGITAGTYGAPLRVNSYPHNGVMVNTSILDIFGDRAARAFAHNELIVGLFKEQGEARKRLEKEERKTFFLREEARIITEPLSRLAEFIVLKHDALIFWGDVDTNYLAHQIKKETGFQIQFDKAIYA
jgi:hypothetical protein